jgi:hypothetical protein
VESQLKTDALLLSKMDVDQFYGIEIEEFPARIAEVALWMMDHIMNNRLSLAFGLVFVRILSEEVASYPQRADALEIDWDQVVRAGERSFVFGNPPFGGFHYRNKQRQKQMKQIKRLGAQGNRIDYVAAWFLTAGAYVQGSQAQIGLSRLTPLPKGSRWRKYGLRSSIATNSKSRLHTGHSRGARMPEGRPTST